MSGPTLKEVSEFAVPHVVTLAGGRQVAFANREIQLHDLEQFLDAPLRLKATLRVSTLESFQDYVERWKQPQSGIYACRKALRFGCIIDDHEGADGDVAPSWRQHTVSYTCQLSDPWQVWMEANKNKLSQLKFLELLEDNLADIREPDGSDLLSMITKFREVRTSVFGSDVTLQSGEFSFEYTNNRTSEKGHARLPEVLKLGIPVFEKGEVYQVTARLRYRIHAGELVLWVEFVNPDRYVDHAFNEIAQKVRTKFDKQPFYEVAE